MLNEFKQFISRGNVIDLAVGIIIGAAFTGIVNSLVKDIIMPPIGKITGGLDFSNYFVGLSAEHFPTLKAAQEAGVATINYGLFLNQVINFLIVAFAVFMIVKQANRFKKTQPPAAPTRSETLLEEIRDLLKKKLTAMKRLPLILTIAGALPFAALSACVSLRLFDNTQAIIELLLTYAAVILSFLGGIHWGIAVLHYGNNRKIANLLIAESVIPLMIAWGTLFLADIHIQLLALTLLYTFMWAIDSLLYNNDLIPQWFFTLRCIITPVIVVSLYVAYFGLI